MKPSAQVESELTSIIYISNEFNVTGNASRVELELGESFIVLPDYTELVQGLTRQNARERSKIAREKFREAKARHHLKSEDPNNVYLLVDGIGTFVNGRDYLAISGLDLSPCKVLTLDHGYRQFNLKHLIRVLRRQFKNANFSLSQLPGMSPFGIYFLGMSKFVFFLSLAIEMPKRILWRNYIGNLNLAGFQDSWRNEYRQKKVYDVVIATSGHFAHDNCDEALKEIDFLNVLLEHLHGYNTYLKLKSQELKRFKALIDSGILTYRDYSSVDYGVEPLENLEVAVWFFGFADSNAILEQVLLGRVCFGYDFIPRKVLFSDRLLTKMLKRLQIPIFNSGNLGTLDLNVTEIEELKLLDRTNYLEQSIRATKYRVQGFRRKFHAEQYD